jgi:hypothetical protein
MVQLQGYNADGELLIGSPPIHPNCLPNITAALATIFGAYKEETFANP